MALECTIFVRRSCSVSLHVCCCMDHSTEAQGGTGESNTYVSRTSHGIEAMKW